MSVPRIEYKGHLPQPMGIRKACVKMALIEAELTRSLPLPKSDADMLAQIRAEIGPMQLTESEAAQAARIGIFLCGEYDRLSVACEEKDKVIGELRGQITSLEERVRDLSGAGQATDGGTE